MSINFCYDATKILAVINCQAHKKGNYFVIKGNNAADLEAKKKPQDVR